MDPDKTLEKMLRLALKTQEQWDPDEGVGIDALELAELVIAMHEWITNGGYLPKAWRK